MSRIAVTVLMKRLREFVYLCALAGTLLVLAAEFFLAAMKRLSLAHCVLNPFADLRLNLRVSWITVTRMSRTVFCQGILPAFYSTLYTYSAHPEHEIALTGRDTNITSTCCHTNCMSNDEKESQDKCVVVSNTQAANHALVISHVYGLGLTWDDVS